MIRWFHYIKYDPGLKPVLLAIMILIPAVAASALLWPRPEPMTLSQCLANTRVSLLEGRAAVYHVPDNPGCEQAQVLSRVKFGLAHFSRTTAVSATMFPRPITAKPW